MQKIRSVGVAVILLLALPLVCFGQDIETLKKENSELEQFVLPPKGTIKKSVEEVYGEAVHGGETSQFSHYLLNGQYQIDVQYDNNTVVSAFVPVSPQPAISKEALISQYKQSIAALTAIKANYLEKLNKANWNQPLQLTIKSDKEVYDAGESIKVISKIKNITSEPIYLCKYPDASSVILGPSVVSGNGIWGHGLRPKKEDFVLVTKEEPVIEELDLTEDIKSVGTFDYSFSNTYRQTGNEYGLNAWTGTLASNTITIEVVEKREISKEEALKLVQDYIKEHNISVIDINAPLSIKEYSRIANNDSWLIHYEYERKYQADPPPYHVFVVNKKTQEISEVPLL
ncbi:MAG: hypothetical protein ABIA97_06730 [Candidatus Omnitrophota bacterium]